MDVSRQVWKDVNGMMTADPRAVKAAVPVPCVSYEEAAELAYFGANILHPVSKKDQWPGRRISGGYDSTWGWYT